MADTDIEEPLAGESGETRGSGIVAIVGLTIVLAITWLLWSGLIKPLLLFLGAVSCGLSVWLAVRMGFLELQPILRLLPRLPFYWLWLLKEIAKSSWEVATVVLSPKLNLSPTIVDIEADPKTEMGQVILGNSITLTPGTITLDIHNGRLVVHCLTKAGAEDLQQGVMNRRVAGLEEK